MKHRPAPAICERCGGRINDQSGWGVLMVCSIQPQPNGGNEPREMGLQMCGYCFHELGDWLFPAIDEEKAS